MLDYKVKIRNCKYRNLKYIMNMQRGQKMKVRNFICGPLHNNNYVIIDDDTKKAVLIDCSDANNDIIKYINEQGASLEYILLTHGHFDHILGLNYFKEKYGVDFYINQMDVGLLNQINSLTDIMPVQTQNPPKPKGTFTESSQFFVGNIPVKIIHTSGHTKGSSCFLINGTLFSGDTMFFETYGRTDLLGGSDKEMRESIAKLLTLPDDTVVLPGHGKPTTISHEKKTYNL